MTRPSFRRLPAPILPIFSILALVLALPARLTAQAPATVPTQAAGTTADFPEGPTLAAMLPDSGNVFAPEPYRPVTAVSPKPAKVNSIETVPHRFFDRENTFLFAATGAMATADFFATHANLAHGGQELNPLTRPFASSTPLLAANFAMETAGVVGVGYLFHKTGHHTLERMTSFVSIGGSAGAVAYDLSHR